MRCREAKYLGTDLAIVILATDVNSYCLDDIQYGGQVLEWFALDTVHEWQH